MSIIVCILYDNQSKRVFHQKKRMILQVKNMVSLRCKMVVEQELTKIGLHCVSMELGEVEILEDISPMQRSWFKTALAKSGLELMCDKKAMLIERIKNAIVTMIHSSDDSMPKINFSSYINEKLPEYNYTYLANVFSETEGTTIEHFMLMHKIERIKELIRDDEMTFSEIAWKLHYSSAAALSNQFKQFTGQTPSFFKSEKRSMRMKLEEVGIEPAA